MEARKRNQANLLARECMVSALMQLLETKPLSAVTVTEITKRAGVSRMTYYRNYQSKDEIFSSYLEDVFSAYRADVEGWPDRGGYQDSRNLLHCFRYFRAHSSFIRCLLQCGMGDLLLNALTRYVTDTYFAGKDRERDAGLYYRLQAFAGSLYNVYIAWIRSDTRESAEEMAAVIGRIYQD